MASSVERHASSDPVRSLDNVRPRPVKAGLPSDAIGLNDTLGDAVVDYYGSVKAAAYELGQVDPSLMRREFKAGNFSRVERHDTDGGCRAFMAKRMQDVYGPLAATPAARLRQLSEQQRHISDELAQLAAHIA